MNKINVKRVKVAIASFLVLGFTGIAIVKAKSIIEKNRAKKGKPKKEGLFSRMFDINKKAD